MLGTFRSLLATWPAKLFFLLLASAFALWGVANKNPFGADAPDGLTVAGRSIPPAEVQQAFKDQLARALRSSGQTEPSPELRAAVARQAVERVATQAALAAKLRDLGVAAPDSALREAAFAIPAFQKDGKYDRPTMLAVLRDHGLTEAHFLDMLHDDLGQQQLQGAVIAGTTTSDILARKVYAFEHEKRVADVVDFPFSHAPLPASPTPAQLERWYANHPESYSTPEYRHIKAIVLTSETVGRDLSASDDELRAYWDQHKADFVQPERRSLQVLTGLPDEASAQRLVTQWLTGADWASMQAQSQSAGGASLELPDAARSDVPDPELAQAAFAAAADTVAPPVKTALGWDVVKVTKLSPGGSKTFDDARSEVRARVVADKAVDALYDRANRLEDLLSGGTKLADLPGDLGAAAVTGTLDAQGRAPGGEDAPIPGGAELRTALIQAVFAAHAGDPAKLLTASGTAKGYYAFELDAITPPAQKPYAEVADTVRADWTGDAVHRSQDAAAAGVLAGIQDGGSLAVMAAKSGLTVRRLPATTRDQPADGVPPQLLPVLFSLKLHEATMIERPDGFLVAELQSIEQPDPAADPVGYQRVKTAMTRGLQEDMQASFASMVRDAAKPQVNPRLLADLARGAE